mmetsp:Transcript_12117/g.28743  ORF Transcript_12117/g.28743 Transcript_12117/m.28743 type:complete len:250 (+) Transcript_12117:219-968(+)
MLCYVTSSLVGQSLARKVKPSVQAQDFRRSLRVLSRRSLVMKAEGSGYKFGDLTRKFVKDVKSKLDETGKQLSGDDTYQFGDFSKRLVSALRESAASVDVRKLSSEVVERLKSYEFGDITKSLLSSDATKRLVEKATETGQTLTGDMNYRFGDLTRSAASKLADAKTRAERLVSLPDEVDSLRQIVFEQTLVIQSLTGELEEESGRATQALQLKGSVEELKPIVLDNQEAIDVLVSSAEEANQKEQGKP